MHPNIHCWRRKYQPTPIFLPEKSHGQEEPGRLQSMESQRIRHNWACTHPIVIVALFTIAKTWKQPKCLSSEECMKNMWYKHTMEYYSAIKKNEIMPFAVIWMDLDPRHYHTKWSQRKTNIISLICGHVLVTQLCLTLCDPMDSSWPHSSVHGIL